MFALGSALLAISAHWRVRPRAEGLLGLAAGALFGVSDVATKSLTHAEGLLYGLLSPWTGIVLLAGVIAFYASARSLRSDLPSRSSPSPRWPRTWSPSWAASSSSTSPLAPA